MRFTGRVTIIVAYARHESSGVLNPIAQRACHECLNGQFRLNASFESASIRTHHAVTREIIAVERRDAICSSAFHVFQATRSFFFSPREKHCIIVTKSGDSRWIIIPLACRNSPSPLIYRCRVSDDYVPAPSAPLLP